jgi:hypothetical protein
MISPISSAAATAGIVVVSNVLAKKPVTSRLIIGSGVYLFFLAALNESRPELAAQFAILVLVAVLFTYTPTLFKGLGLDK